MAAKKQTFLTPVKVGVFVVASVAAFIGFLQIVSTRQISRAGSYEVYALFTDDAIVAEVREMSEAMKKLVAGTPEHPAPLQEIVRDVQGSAAAARVVLEEVSRNINSNTEKLNNILDNVDRFTADLKDISE